MLSAAQVSFLTTLRSEPHGGGRTLALAADQPRNSPITAFPVPFHLDKSFFHFMSFSSRPERQKCRDCRHQHRRISMQHRYERSAATSQFSAWCFGRVSQLPRQHACSLLHSPEFHHQPAEPSHRTHFGVRYDTLGHDPADGSLAGLPGQTAAKTDCLASMSVPGTTPSHSNICSKNPGFYTSLPPPAIRVVHRAPHFGTDSGIDSGLNCVEPAPLFDSGSPPRLLHGPPRLPSPPYTLSAPKHSPLHLSDLVCRLPLYPTPNCLASIPVTGGAEWCAARLDWTYIGRARRCRRRRSHRAFALQHLHRTSAMFPTSSSPGAARQRGGLR
ncbi:hypothetical protein BU16DRAFT_535479 [Lophium mytilinum]|uniref:Uncharacterized protein n=1 Tax=Lophium mytilinum TaxID=390894 RepID=A0A6A6R403_9PEZI|nr:hypothetical protein BU16DRAFT_535479 [Lophium mytilinum]